MSKNKTLSNAKSATNDEHYIQLAYIQKEVNAYLDCVTSGATDIKNCQMLRKPHNGAKGNK